MNTTVDFLNTAVSPSECVRLANAANDAAWDALERFLQQLRGGRHARDQYSEALAAIREATGASFVFLYSKHIDGVLEVDGTIKAPTTWYREFSRTVAACLGEGGVWQPEEPTRVGTISGVGSVESAVFLPVEAPRPAYLIAVGLGEDRRLQASDFRAMRVIWRLQLAHEQHLHLYDKLRETLFGIVRCLSAAIEAKDPLTSGHSERVARIATRLGKEMKLARGEISDLYLAGLLHDVGKIGIRDDVLLKPGPLSPSEAAHMREHPALGERIIESVSRLAYLCPAIRGHHERIDGRGYPDGLAGEAIPLMARILAVADSCDAMMSDRRYRSALPREKIEAIFWDGAGSAWDARVVEAFFTCRNELYEVCSRGLGQSVYMAVERAAGGDQSHAGRPAFRVPTGAKV